MLPLNNINLPPAPIVLAGAMISICEFDLLPPELTTDFIFEYDEDINQFMADRFDWLITKQMQEFNIESHNSIKILGSIFILLVFWVARIFL